MSGDVRHKKKELRKKILALRDSLPSEERQQKSRSIHSRLFSLPEFIAARTVAFFVSFKSEVITETMIKESLSLGKAVVVPVTDLADKKLQFSLVLDYETDLAPGTWGILEPRQDRVQPVPIEEINLIITPGAAFDVRGNRIGYGGGFYDGLLRSTGNRIPAVSLAFEVQIVGEVPVNPVHDEPVDLIVTEERIIRCNN